MRRLKKLLFYFWVFFFKILPLKKKCVLFSCFTKTYNDNQKYISKKLFEKNPKIKQVWAVADKFDYSNLPKYITWVKENSFRHAYYSARAKVLVDGYVGIISYMKNGQVSKRSNWLYKNFKRKKQINFSTWHGTPLKKIGKHSLLFDKESYFYCSTDAMLLNSQYIKDIMQSAFGISNAYIIGSARNDVLFSNQSERLKTKERLGLPLDKKIVLYAPTYRDVVGGKSASVYMDKSQIEACTNALSSRFGGEWAFVYRVHKKVLEDGGLVDFDKDSVIDGNRFDDMAKYLSVCDVLITDYSGSLFDFTVTKKPCFLYAPDYEYYKNESRGLYMDMQELPYPYAFTSDQLEQCILSYNEGQTIEAVDKFNQKLGMIDDGFASDRIADLIVNKIYEK